MVDYNDGKWHGWNGGECPVHPDSFVDVLYDDDYKIVGGTAGMKNGVRWVHNWDGRKIIAFRVIKEYKEPREVFLSQNPHSGGWFEALPEHKYAVKFREVTE